MSLRNATDAKLRQYKKKNNNNKKNERKKKAQSTFAFRFKSHSHSQPARVHFMKDYMKAFAKVEIDRFIWKIRAKRL